MLPLRPSGPAMQNRSKPKDVLCDLSIRQIIAAALLLVFSVVNFAVQTHIHGTFIVDSTAGIAGQVVSGPGPAIPADNDLEHCSLCQEFTSSGSFTMPTALAVIVPGVAAEAVLPAIVGSVSGHLLSHSWQGRGPPAI